VAGGDYTRQGNQTLECVNKEILQKNVQNELTNLANQEVSLKSYERCEAFLHTFNMKICTHKTRLELELLCSYSLTSKVVHCNAMKFTKNLMRCVHLEDTKTL
jgi:hypothetical protein